MVKLVLLFKRATDTGSFEWRFKRTLALMGKMPGVQQIVEGKVLGGPAGETPFHRTLEIIFESFEALDAALTSPEGVAAGKHVMGFAGTDVELLFVEIQSEEQAEQPLTPQNLRAWLDNRQIEAEIVHPGAPTPTVAAAAEALGVEPGQIVKSVVFLVDNRPFLVYACGTRRVDPRKLAERLNVNRKQVILANADQVLDLTGYAVGTVPPLGLKTPMPAFMDPSTQNYDVVYAGGGGIDALLKITSQELLRASNAEIAPMLRDEKGTPGEAANELSSGTPPEPNQNGGPA
jgi:uncharacterized protein (TIGR02118 family)